LIFVKASGGFTPVVVAVCHHGRAAQGLQDSTKENIHTLQMVYGCCQPQQHTMVATYKGEKGAHNTSLIRSADAECSINWLVVQSQLEHPQPSQAVHQSDLHCTKSNAAY
jgi:hypothetical protein